MANFVDAESEREYIDISLMEPETDTDAMDNTTDQGVARDPPQWPTRTVSFGVANSLSAQSWFSALTIATSFHVFQIPISTAIDDAPYWSDFLSYWPNARIQPNYRPAPLVSFGQQNQDTALGFPKRGSEV